MSLLGLIIMIDQFFKKMSNYHFLFIVLFQGLENMSIFQNQRNFFNKSIEIN